MFNSIEVVKELQEMRDDGFLSDALLRRAVKSIASSDERVSWVGAFMMRTGLPDFSQCRGIACPSINRSPSSRRSMFRNSRNCSAEE